MPANSSIPFNVSIFSPTPADLQNIKPVTSLDIFAGNTRNYHEEGLFSISIFGPPGDESRSTRFSYIDIKVPIFNTTIYRVLCQLKRLYPEIIAGKTFAKWDDTVMDFVAASPADGETGFNFFVQHWKDIVFVDTGSDTRRDNVALLTKYKDTALTSKILVGPAGIRDITIELDRVRENEINPFYRKLLSIANTISDTSVKSNPGLLDASRWSLQRTFNELYDYVESMIDGKKKLILGKWASRRPWNGTRNVITAMDTSTAVLGDKLAPGFNSTIIGIYQLMKAILPVARHYVRTGILGEIFNDVNAPVKLIDKKTLKTMSVNLRPEYFDRWNTDEGIDKVISSFSDENLRHKYVEVNGHYLGLIYLGPDGTFKVFRDISELPETLNKADVRPITYCELMYTSLYQILNKYPLFITRYPVAGMGSIYPSFAYVRTTVRSERRAQLGPDWTPMGEGFIAPQMPILGDNFVNSFSPHSARLKGLVADFDGDTGSANAGYSDETVVEIGDFLQTAAAYINVDGNLMASCNIDTVAYVSYNMTGGKP